MLLSPPRTPHLLALLARDRVPPLQHWIHSNGSFAILDGELYNADELAGGCRFENHAALLLDRYRRDGDHGVGGADMSALLIVWDAAREQLSVYRDRIGRAPGYYLEIEGALLWSSNIRGLLDTRSAWTLDRRALDAFLACGFIPAPWTLVEGVLKIPPGHVLTCRPGGSPVVRSFWRHSAMRGPALRGRDFQQRLEPLLAKTLQSYYSSNPKTGVLLSGGVDSKLVVAGLTKLLGRPGRSIATFTFHYTEYEGPNNELPLARQAADYFGTAHHEIRVEPGAIPGQLDRMLQCFEEPFTYGLHTFMLDDAATNSTGVILTGNGVDAHYLDPIEYYTRKYRRLARALVLPMALGRDVVWRSYDGSRRIPLPRLRRTLRRCAKQADDLLWSVTHELPVRCGPYITPDWIRRRLYSDEAFVSDAPSAREALFAAVAAEFAEEPDRARCSFIQQRLFSAECTLHCYQAASRAHGVVFRHPFRANDIIELASHLPRDNPRARKREIRELAATLMPRDLAYAPKISQSVPIREWLRGSLKPFLTDTLSEQRLRQDGLFNPKAVSRLIDEHLSGHAHHGWILWSVIAVLAWKDLFLKDRAVPNRNA